METKNTVKTVLAIFIAIFVFVNSSLAQHWKTTGNSTSNPDPISGTSILGTISPSIPLNIWSGNVHRVVINPNLTTTINGVNQDVSGYFGIGPTGYFLNRQRECVI